MKDPYLLPGLLFALEVAAGLLLADYVATFVVTSYLYAWLAGGSVAIALLALLFRGRPRGARRALAALPSAILVAVLLLLPFRDRRHKAFYEAYKRVVPGMPVGRAVAVLGAYPVVRRSERTIHYRYTEEPHTTDFVTLTIRDGRVVDKSYSWD